MNDNKNKEDYNIHGTQLNQQCFASWSPLDENKFLLKKRYVPCNRSVPRKSKQFLQYKLNRSLNFDKNSCNSSSENSSFEEDKHLSRSAKIMRALSFNTSPSYYGRTKIKKSLNFNSTPSPKRFMPMRKGIRKALSLSFSSPLSVSNKASDFDHDLNDSANSNLIFTSPESTDENQNETPSQQNTKRYKRLHYSTPNTKLSKKSSCSSNFTPLLHNQLKETIDNIIYISATPNSHSLKYIKRRSISSHNIITNTSRNLFHEFHDKDDDRPQTPENFIRIIPESMSAIKRSHKKERLSKRTERCPTQFPNNSTNNTNVLQNVAEFASILHKKHTDSIEDSDSIEHYSEKNLSSKEIPLCNSENDVSDTGSLFDYTEELKDVLQKFEEISDSASNCNDIKFKFYKCDMTSKPKENVDNLSEIQSLNYNEKIQGINDIRTDDSSIEEHDVKPEIRPITPEIKVEIVPESQKAITPENRVNVLQKVAEDSIKKSRRKNKDDNKRKFFSSNVPTYKLEVTEPENVEFRQNLEEDKCIGENKVIEEQNYQERACTPEKINSSRLLLSQYSSVKKSHKKDKHNKIVSGFLKRQEYFNKEIDFIDDAKITDTNDGLEYKKSSEDLSSDFDIAGNLDDSSSSASHVDENTSLNKLSPSKRKITLDSSLDHNTSNTSCDSELNECDVSTEEFKIFTPLKRKRKSLIAPNVKEYLHFYNLPSGKDEISKEDIEGISLSRCLTPILSFQNNCTKSDGNRLATVNLNDSGKSEELEIHDCDCKDITGRSTPRNMSTVELYNNIDSIKKSHKKNKRGNCLRKNINLVKSNFSDEKSQTLSDDVKSETHDELKLSDDCITGYDMNKSDTDKSIDYDNEESTNSRVSEENLANTSTNMGNVSQTVTPPNCLKTKNYIKLLRETSIKQSHKKIRDQKKYELAVEANELSDDGSIFGDEEKLDLTEDETTKK